MLKNHRQTLTEAAGTEGNGLYRLSIARPFLVPLVLLALALALRIVDVGLLRLDEKWGEAILHKALGFGLVLLYLWLAGQPVREIGLHGRQVGKAMLISAFGTILLLVLAYGLQWVILRIGGKQTVIAYAAIDSKEGKSGGLPFALWLLLGNLVNSFMEESLFRGVMMRHFARRMSPWKANWLQAVIFAAWHLVGPAKHYFLGKTDLAGAVAEGAFIFLGSGASGFAYGALYLKTDSLWAPWIGHTINNTVLNMLHFATVGGLVVSANLLYPLAGLGYIGLVFWVKAAAKRFKMPQMQPWGTETDGLVK